MPKPGGNAIALAIFIASAVTSPDERPCALAVTTIMRLEFACWILDGALPIVTVAICSSGTMRSLPAMAIGRRSILLASTRSSGARRTATSRASPVGSIQSPASTPANATRSDCAASLTDTPIELARPRSRSMRSSCCGSCSDRPTSTAPLTWRSLSMKSLVIASRRRESLPWKRICTGFCAPLLRSSSTVYSAPTRRAICLRRSLPISVALRLRCVLLPMSM